MVNLLPAFDATGQEGKVFSDVTANIDKKLQKLKDFQVSILDVSIREPTAYSSWAHRLSDKMDTLKLIREFGFQDIMLGEFKPWDTVDEQFCKLLSDKEKSGCFAFAPIGAINNGAIDLDKSIPLQKAAAYAPNVLFEFSISTANEKQAEETLERFNLSIEWIRQTWKERGITHDDLHGRIYINIYDTFEAFYRNKDIYIRVIKYLGEHPYIDAVLFEDELGTSFHFQVGELTRLVRSLVPPSKKILVHLHENSGTMYASALEVVLNGGDGLWAGFVPVGGMLNNASSSVFLANLLRVDNKNVTTQFDMKTLIPLVRKLDRINQPSPTDYCHPIIGKGAYLSTLYVFEQHAGDPMSLPPEAIGAERGFRVVPAIANNYAMSHRLDELGITYPSQPSATVEGERELQEHIFRTMWDLMQQSLITGRKVDCNEEAVLRENLDRAREIHSGYFQHKTTPKSFLQLKQGLIFNGNTRIHFSDPLPSITTEITVEFWAKSTVTAATSIIEAHNTQNARVLNIHLPWSNSHIYWDAGNEGKYDRINKNAPSNEYRDIWVHWAFIKNSISGQMSIYRNGDLWHQGDNHHRSLVGIDRVVIGSYVNGSHPWKGQLSEFRIWNIARAPEAIKEDMRYRLLGNESGLSGYWPLDEGAGDIAYDHSSNNNNGTIEAVNWI